jgi:hypothetical protein
MDVLLTLAAIALDLWAIRYVTRANRVRCARLQLGTIGERPVIVGRFRFYLLDAGRVRVELEP